MLRYVLDRLGEALQNLRKELHRPEFLSLLLVTVILITRTFLKQPPGSHWLTPVWRWFALRTSLLAAPLFQRQALSIGLQLGLPILAIVFVHRARLRDYGLQLGDVRFWGPVTWAIFLVQVVVV